MTKKPNYVFDDELYHHGILGQRWGRRRFQNEDGSWTPEGRERYGEGGARQKSDVQKYKAKMSYSTQKYKAGLKAKIERNKIKEQAKTEKVARKEQGKLDRQNKKELARLDKQGRSESYRLKRTRNMSDEDLQKAVERLKLQAEYNKNYVLATQPSSALAKADRFFEGPTGQMVRAVAVAAAPKIAETATKEILGAAFKYPTAQDRQAKAVEIEKSKADIEKLRADTEKVRADAKSVIAGIKSGNNQSNQSNQNNQNQPKNNQNQSKQDKNPVFNININNSPKVSSNSDSIAKAASNAASIAKSAAKIVSVASPIINNSNSTPVSSITRSSGTVLPATTAKAIDNAKALPVSQVLALPAKVKKYNY